MKRIDRLPLALIALAMFSWLAGCSPPRPPLVVTDPDPAVKIPAIKMAVQHHDHSAEQQMVKDLYSDDPAVRFYAIDGLRKLTGEDFGYVFYQNADVRKPAAERWEAWLKKSDRTDASASATTSPTISPATSTATAH